MVPNPDLLDNHQEELAKELANQGYVVHGRLKLVNNPIMKASADLLLSNLPSAIRQSEAKRASQKTWPPVNSGEDPSGRGLAGVMDDEMGFVD